MGLLDGGVPGAEVIVAAVHRKRRPGAGAIIGVGRVISKANEHGVAIREVLVNPARVLLHGLLAAVEREIVIRLRERVGARRRQVRRGIELVDRLRHGIQPARRDDIARKRRADTTRTAGSVRRG